MADLEPKRDVLDNLNLLLDLEILKNEKDWGVIKTIDNEVMMRKCDQEKKDDQNEK